MVLTAEYDPLRDEGEAYAERLEQAGVAVDFKRHKRQPHGFFTLLMLLGSESGRQQVVKGQKPTVKVGTELAAGEVAAIKNDHVLVKTRKGVKKFTFSEIEEMSDAK